jgi:hypothetical protein
MQLVESRLKLELHDVRAYVLNFVFDVQCGPIREVDCSNARGMRWYAADLRQQEQAKRTLHMLQRPWRRCGQRRGVACSASRLERFKLGCET